MRSLSSIRIRNRSPCASRASWASLSSPWSIPTAIRLFTSKISESIAEGVHARDDKQMADIQAVAEPEAAAEAVAPEAEELFAAVAVDSAPVPDAAVEGTGEEIRME